MTTNEWNRISLHPPPLSYFIYTWISCLTQNKSWKKKKITSQYYTPTLHFCHLPSLSNLKRYTSLYWLQLQAHAFWCQKLRGDTRRAKWAPWTTAETARPIKPIPHKEVLHGYQHRMGLLFRHHWSACLNLQSTKSNIKDIHSNFLLSLPVKWNGWTECFMYLNQCTVSSIQLSGHVNGFRMEGRVLANKNKSPAL